MTNLELAGKIFLAEMQKIDDLSPSKIVNELFTKFCNECIKSDDSIQNQQLIQETSKICAHAEEKMEHFWANKIINSNFPQKELESFWYYENYKKLTQLEYVNLSFFIENIQNIIFLGSGPLPLSAIFLAKKGIRITLIDNNEEAIKISKKLINALNLTSQIDITKADARTFYSEKKFDAVIGASLLFLGNDNESILKNISRIQTKYFLLRTSAKGKKLLYKPIEKNLVRKFFKTEIVVHPRNDLVNSFIIVTKK